LGKAYTYLSASFMEEKVAGDCPQCTVRPVKRLLSCFHFCCDECCLSPTFMCTVGGACGTISSWQPIPLEIEFFLLDVSTSMRWALDWFGKSKLQLAKDFINGVIAGKTARGQYKACIIRFFR